MKALLVTLAVKILAILHTTSTPHQNLWVTHPIYWRIYCTSLYGSVPSIVSCHVSIIAVVNLEEDVVGIGVSQGAKQSNSYQSGRSTEACRDVHRSATSSRSCSCFSLNCPNLPDTPNYFYKLSQMAANFI